MEGWHIYAARNCAKTEFLDPLSRDPYGFTFFLVHCFQKEV